MSYVYVQEVSDRYVICLCSGSEWQVCHMFVFRKWVTGMSYVYVQEVSDRYVVCLCSGSEWQVCHMFMFRKWVTGMSYVCVQEVSDRYVVCYVKHVHHTWTTQILALIILIDPDVVGLLTSWPTAMCDFCTIPCRGCFVAHVSCHISILCSRSDIADKYVFGFCDWSG
jgi:hypothetical protein